MARVAAVRLSACIFGGLLAMLHLVFEVRGLV